MCAIASLCDGGISGTALEHDLLQLYTNVPATRCAGSGDCCRLTDEEYRGRFATMFPLYRIEYVNVVSHVKAYFDAARQESLRRYNEERPRRCPFLGPENQCTIYPARPLICRTYAVMQPETIAAAVQRHRDRLPADWLRQFALREGAMVCPRARVTEPQKLEEHAERLVSMEYDRELGHLSRSVVLLSAAQQDAFTQVTGRRHVPLRWSWGGFNAVCGSTPEQLLADFRAYWDRAELADAG